MHTPCKRPSKSQAAHSSLQDRFEFSIFKRSGGAHTFRAATREQFTSWTEGLQQYVAMVRFD